MSWFQTRPAISLRLIGATGIGKSQSKGVAVVKSICGVLVILGGVWLIYAAT